MPATVEPLNYLAIIIGTVAAFLLGWLIYSPMLFGPKWAEGSGVKMGEASEMPKFAMASQFAALFCLALVIGITATVSALWTAILAIVAAALFVVSSGAFLKKSNFAMAVDGGYILASGVVMIIVQGLL
jgi:hypothetical protein